MNWNENKKEKIIFGAKCVAVGVGIGFACGIKTYSKYFVQLISF